MSLILEALRKLDREKQVAERGFLVVGAAGLAGPRTGRTARIITAVAILATLGLASLWALRSRSAVGPSPAPRPVAGSQPLTPATLAASPPEVAALTPSVSLPTPRLEPTPSPAVAPMASVAGPETPRESPRPQPSPRFVLQAISERDGRKVALLNDRLVREGDALDGAVIVHIGEAEVELELAGRRLVVRF